VVEVELPSLPYDSLMNIVYAEAAAAFEDLPSPRTTREKVLGNSEVASDL
jgi:hypothetical protein